MFAEDDRRDRSYQREHRSYSERENDGVAAVRLESLFDIEGLKKGFAFYLLSHSNRIEISENYSSNRQS